MEEEVAAFIVDVAPGEKRAEWNQKGLRRVLQKWEQTRPKDFETVRSSENFGMVVGFQIWSSGPGQGQYGYDIGLHFKPDIEDHLLDDVEGGHLAHDFYEDWMDAIRKLIEEDQERTLFSPKEYATFFAHRHPARPEARHADGLGITVGTFRGKVGRVKEKLNTARATLALEEHAPEDAGDDWFGPGYSAHPSVIYRVDESELPINSIMGIAPKGSGITLDDRPLDELLRD